MSRHAPTSLPAPVASGAWSKRRRRRVVRLPGAVAVGSALAAFVGAAPAQAAPVWLAATTLSPAGQAAGSQQVVADAAGDTTAVWSGKEGADLRVVASTRPAGSTWSTPVDLSTGGRDGVNPVVGIDGAGDVTVVWIRSDGSNTRAQTASLTAGGTWTAPVNLSAAGTNATAPALAVNASGDAIAGWVDDHGPIQLEIAARDGAGGAWQPAADVSGTGGTPIAPQLAIDSGGNGSAVWAQSGPGTIGQRIQFSGSPPQGIWSSPINLSDLGGPSEAPDIAADDNGDLAAVWDRYDTGGYQVQGRTLSASTGSWDPIVTFPSSNPADTGGTSDAHVAMNAGGDIVASWMRVPQVGLKRVEVATRAAGGGAWSAVSALSAPTITAALDRNAISANGDAVVVWAATAEGVQRVQAATRPAGGAWSAAVNVTPAGVSSFAPSVTLDSAGNGVAAWAQGDGTTNAVQASGLDNAGPQLTGVGIPSTATVGTGATFSSTVVDTWSAIGSVIWSFGDGASGSGATLSHTYGVAGTYDVTVTATDGAGNATTKAGRITVAALPPAPAGAATPVPSPTPSPIVGRATDPDLINPETVVPLNAAGQRVPAAMRSNALTFFLDLARTGKACPIPRAVTTTLRMTVGKKTTSAKLLKRRFTVTPSTTRKVCVVRGAITLATAPRSTAKLRLVFRSRSTRTKTIKVVFG